MVWIARHDNGWQTHVEERPDGTYAAWAIPEGQVVSGPDYIEMDVENAQRAAEYALRTKAAKASVPPSRLAGNRIATQ